MEKKIIRFIIATVMCSSIALNGLLLEEIDTMTKTPPCNCQIVLPGVLDLVPEAQADVKQEDYISLTSDERELIKGIVRAEVRGCDDFCLQAIAECLCDRYENGHYGKSITAVCTAKNQFAKPLYSKESEEFERRLDDAINKVFVNGEKLFDEPILHFHANWITPPSWTKNLTVLATCDGVIYYN